MCHFSATTGSRIIVKRQNKKLIVKKQQSNEIKRFDSVVTSQVPSLQKNGAKHGKEKREEYLKGKRE